MKSLRLILSQFKINRNLNQLIKRKLLYIIVLISISFYNCSNSEDVIPPELRIATLSTTTISNILAKSVILSSSIIDDGNSSIIERGFVWSTLPNPTINDNTFIDLNTNTKNYTSSIIDLKPNTEYFVRSFAKNSVGISYGIEANFKTNHHIYDGDVDLSSQNEIDTFGEERYTKINGHLVIGPNIDIISLDKLSDLTLIIGKLEIYFVSNLETLQGLENITSVQNLYIYNTGLTNLDGLIGLTSILGEVYVSHISSNSNLTNIDGLTNISTIFGLSILDNDSLSNINGLSNFPSSLKSLEISLNPLLTNLDSLINITALDNLNILGNDNLTNINGLSNINSINNSLYIASNPLITNLNGLSSLATAKYFNLSNNKGLLSIDGLQNLSSVGFRCTIVDNELLNDFCALSPSLFNNSFEFSTLRNAFNPTKNDILNGNCSH